MALETSYILPVGGSIDSKKEDLTKSIAALQSYSSGLTSFNRKWKDLEAHFSCIEKSIEKRFRDVLGKEGAPTFKKLAAALPASEKVKEEDEEEAEPRPELFRDVPDKEGTPTFKKLVAALPSSAKVKEEEAEPRPELKHLCAEMDTNGLRSYIMENRSEIQTIRRELGPALRSAMDPVTLVLDSLHGFFHPRNEKDENVLSVRRTCATLLESLHQLSPEIRPSDRKRAELVAVEWKGKISDSNEDNSLVASSFLYLVAIFGLVDLFEVDDILDLLVLIVRRKGTVELCRSAGLEDKMPEFVNKLSSIGRQLDAVKFVSEFNLFNKYPPGSLLKAYVKNSKKAAEEVRLKGNNSLQSVNEAIAKELASLNNVIKIVEEYNLGSAYQCDGLRKRIEQLEKQKPTKKRPAAVHSATTNSKLQAKKQNQLKSNKRMRPSSASDVAAPLPPHQQTRPGPVDGSPYRSLGSSYSLAAPVPHIYDHVGPSYSGNPIGLHGAHVPPSSHPYSSEPLLGSGYYNNYRAVSYGGYPVSGLSTPYIPSRYP